MTLAQFVSFKVMASLEMRNRLAAIEESRQKELKGWTAAFEKMKLEHEVGGGML